MRHHSDREWTASDIATELRATQSAIELRLDDLTSRHLVRKASQGAYRYEPSGEFDGVVNELAQVYQTRRTSVIQTIFSGPSEAVRSFADAFRLGPEEEEEEEEDG